MVEPQSLELVWKAYSDLWPWHWELWQKAVSQGKPLLLIGFPRQGVLPWGIRLIQGLFCQKSNPPCGQCGACQSILKNQWPWVYYVDLYQQNLSVDEIRHWLESLNQYGSSDSQPRVFCLMHAHRWSPASANAWLKTLEEAPANTGFLFITHQPKRLLPTIKSRCYQITLPLVSRSKLMEMFPEALPQQIQAAYGQVLAVHSNPATVDWSLFWQTPTDRQSLGMWAFIYQKRVSELGRELVQGSAQLPWIQKWLEYYEKWSIWLKRLASPANPHWQRQALLSSGLGLWEGVEE